MHAVSIQFLVILNEYGYEVRPPRVVDDLFPYSLPVLLKEC